MANTTTTEVASAANSTGAARSASSRSAQGQDSSAAIAAASFDATLQDLACSPDTILGGALGQEQQLAQTDEHAAASVAQPATLQIAQPTTEAVAAQLVDLLGLVPMVAIPTTVACLAPVTNLADTGTEPAKTEQPRAGIASASADGNYQLVPGASQKSPHRAVLSGLSLELSVGNSELGALPAALTHDAATTASALLTGHWERDHKPATAATTVPNIPPGLQSMADHFALQRGVEDCMPRALAASVGSKAWQEQLAGTLTLMIDRGEQLATLRLSPDHLGPLEVRIAVRESEATVWFAAAHSDTRAALEQALPRLRDMLASQGIALAQSGVSGESSRQAPRGSILPLRNAAEMDQQVRSEAAIDGRTIGLVDLYA